MLALLLYCVHVSTVTQLSSRLYLGAGLERLERTFPLEVREGVQELTQRTRTRCHACVANTAAWVGSPRSHSARRAMSAARKATPAACGVISTLLVRVHVATYHEDRDRDVAHASLRRKCARQVAAYWCCPAQPMHDSTPRRRARGRTARRPRDRAWRERWSRR
jgi:hypothetical protein